MEVVVAKTPADMASAAAREVANVLNAKPNAVLGMATGSTPLGLYQELVRLHKKGELDFSHVTTFNLDEYVGLPITHPQSYHHFMHEHLSRHRTFIFRLEPRPTTAPFANGTSSASNNAAASIFRSWESAPTAISASTNPAHPSPRAPA